MRYEAAWNLVGIPSDAKDAAQAAAREAGVSVGEWLTRNILSSLEDIKIPDQTHPRVQLSGQLAELSDRLREFEQQSDSEPLREAVKKLHEGLSRLANEFVHTTGQSAIQLSTLANKLEAVGATLDEARAEISGSANAVEFRLAQVADQAAAQNSTLTGELERLTVKLEDVRTVAYGKLESVEHRLGEIVEHTSNKNSTLAGEVERIAVRLDDVHAKASESSIGLAHQLAQLAEQSASQNSTMAGTLERTVGRLDNIGSEVSLLSSALDDRVSRLTEKSATQESTFARKIENLVNVVNDVRVEASGTSASLGERLAQFVEHSTAQVSGLTGKIDGLNAGLSHVRNEFTLASAGLEQRLGQTADLAAKHTADWTEKLAHLTTSLENVRTEMFGKTGSLAQSLAQTVEQSAVREAALTAKLENLEALLRQVQTEASNASLAFDKRLGEVAGLSANQSTLLTSKLEHLAGNLDDFRTATTGTCEDLQRQLALFQHNQEAHDLRQADVSKAFADKIEGLVLKQNDAAKSVGVELEQLKAQLGRVQADASQAAASIEQRFNQSADRASDQQTELASQIARLAEHFTLKVEATEKNFTQSSEETTTRFTALAGEVSSLKASLAAAFGDSAGASGAVENRIKQLAEGASGQIATLASQLQHLSENFAADRSETTRSAEALEQRLSLLQEGLQRLDSHDQDVSAKFADKLEVMAKGLDDMQTKSAATSTASEAVDRQLAFLQHGLQSITEQQADTAATLAQVRERDSAASASIAKLEDVIVRLEARMAERTLDERVASIERSLTELLNRTSTGAAPVAHKAEQQPDHTGEIPPTAEPTVALAGAAAVSDIAGTEHVVSDAGHESEVPPHAEQIAEEHGAGTEDGPPPVLDSTIVEGEAPPLTVVTDAPDSVGASEQPKSSMSYLSAAREAANAAVRAKAEIVGNNTLNGRVLGSPQSSGAGRFGKMGVGIAAAVGVSAVIVVGAGMYLGSLSRPQGAQTLPRVAGSTFAPKPVLAQNVHAKTATKNSSGPALVPTAVLNDEATRDAQSWNRIVTLAQSGNAHAELIVGLHNLSDTGGIENAAEAAKWLHLAAAQGDAIAQFRLATMYAVGRGMPVDAAKAFDLYKSAAALGNRKAMYNLAVAYLQGSGTNTNPSEAVRWLSNAAKLGLIDAQFDLAVLYERGTGVPQSLQNAYRWYAIAAKGGDTESKERIDALNSQLSSEERNAAQAAAAHFTVSPMDAHANLLTP